MRVSCSICTELLEEDSVIAAVMCGHTFHDHCLQHWLDMQAHKRTCPQCRQPVGKNKVIHKLYFTKADAVERTGGETPDVCKLQNSIDSLRCQVRESEREKNKLLSVQKELTENLDIAMTEKSTLQKDYADKQLMVQSLKQQLKSMQHFRQDADEARNETKQIRKHLLGLQAVESLVKGSESDIQCLIGEHNGDAKQLATWCIILKKELSAKKLECRELRRKYDRVNRDLDICNRILNEKEKELDNSKEQLEHSQEDLKHAEYQLLSLRKKLEALKSSHVNNNMAAISVDRLVDESPAPLSRKRPRLSSPINGDIDFKCDDLDVSVDLFAATPAKKKVLSPETPKTEFIRTTTAVKTNSKPAKQIQDISNIPGISNMNLFKKRGVGEGFTNFRKGYSGLGGHVGFAQPSKLKTALPPKKAINKTTLAQKKPGLSSKKPPPLPTLDSFIAID